MAKAKAKAERKTCIIRGCQNPWTVEMAIANGPDTYDYLKVCDDHKDVEPVALLMGKEG
jgi:hypothetical protein